jgi:hypothetical protein
MPEPPFQVGKSWPETFRKKENWFWDTASSLQKFNWQGAIDYLKNNINSSNFTNGDINKGLVGHRSKLYKL